MSGQFIIGLIILLMAVIVSSEFWRAALQLRSSHETVRFYRLTFWVFAVLLTGVLGLMMTLADLSRGFSEFAQAGMLGLTAGFVFFMLFAWGRLTILGMLYVVNTTQPEG